MSKQTLTDQIDQFNLFEVEFLGWTGQISLFPSVGRWVGRSSMTAVGHITEVLCLDETMCLMVASLDRMHACPVLYACVYTAAYHKYAKQSLFNEMVKAQVMTALSIENISDRTSTKGQAQDRPSQHVSQSRPVDDTILNHQLTVMAYRQTLMFSRPKDWPKSSIWFLSSVSVA